MPEGEINFKSSEKPKNILAEIQEAIESSREKINQEFLKTANSWLACFVSRLFVIETYLTLKNASLEIGGEEKYQAVLERLENLKEKVADLREQYPDKTTVPDADVQEELFTDLKNLI